ncbi:MAG: nitrogenase molybdenum-iron protein subunit beta [Calditerrivibrio sp.]|nr:nitrogenase molybdenum-iron protein subunit beta [Calditerrivibrio sp.]
MKNCAETCSSSMFKCDSYIKTFETKRIYENPHDEETINKVLEYTKTEEYKEKNFQREALVINPLKACQPLGAFYAAIGFKDTLPYLHGSQGCAAYFRSHFSRHFKEPFPAVSDSMTEDAAVFGGHNNMYEGLKNAYTLYKPKNIAICTSCMAEVIGDDIDAFVNNARKNGDIPEDLPVVTAHTPSFVGSHITGYDNMLYSFVRTFGMEGIKEHDGINLFLGFDTYIGNFDEIKRIAKAFDIKITIISDPSDMLNSPTDGKYTMYRGGTALSDLKKAPGARGSIFLQKYSMTKTIEHVKNQWGQRTKVINPIGLEGTDEFIKALSEISGKPVPDSIKTERGQLVDAIADSYYHVHGKTFAINGDPDLAVGVTKFILELGGIPKIVLVTNATKKFEKEIKQLFTQFNVEDECEVFTGKDMWHLRSLLFSDPVDYIIGNTFAKLLTRDTGIPSIRIGFPIFDRHHLHRYPIIGYKGGLNLLTWIVNKILDDLDEKTKDLPNYDIVR